PFDVRYRAHPTLRIAALDCITWGERRASASPGTVQSAATREAPWEVRHGTHLPASEKGRSVAVLPSYAASASAAAAPVLRVQRIVSERLSPTTRCCARRPVLRKPAASIATLVSVSPTGPNANVLATSRALSSSTSPLSATTSIRASASVAGGAAI